MTQKPDVLPVARNGRMAAILAIVSFCLLITASAPVLVSIYSSWHAEEYSHGFFIPVLAILLGWHRLAEFKPRISACWKGLVVLAMGAGLMIIGQLAAFEPLSHYGFIACLAGLVYALYGKAVVYALLPAFVYLLFAIPLPRLIYVALSQDFQLWSSSLGVAIIRLFGMPVFRDGNIIDLGTAKLQVVEACSGLRYMFPLMSFGFLMAWLVNDRWWKKILLFISTVPIAIVINALRIALTGVAVNYWGKGMAEGLMHDMEGWSLFLICIAILAVECWLLLKIGKGGRFRFHYLALPEQKLAGDAVPMSGALMGACAMLAALWMALGTGWIHDREEVTPAHPAFASFPTELGGWQGIPARIEATVEDELKADDYWIADYSKDAATPPVNFYMVYYASQRIGSAAHSPSNCLPGSGWHVNAHEIRQVPLADGKQLAISRMLIKKGDSKQLVYYWFDERGRIITEQYGAKWFMLWDSIFMHRTDGALVRLVTPVGTSEQEAAADARLAEFIAIAYPQVRKFVPGRD